MKKIFFLLTTAIISGSSYADCMFKIMNYTDSAITAKVGFYKGNSKTILALPADTTIEKISSNYLCNDAAPNGLGVTYIMFTKDPDYGGVNYSPIAGKATLMGNYQGMPDGRLVKADNETPLWLNMTDNAVDDNVFEVKLNFTGRPNSRSAGTQ